MSEPNYPRTYYAHQGDLTGFCYLVWHSDANDCDVPAPEGNYVRESDYAELRNERDEALQREAKNADKLRHYRIHFIPKLEAQLAELRDECERLRDVRAAAWQWWRSKRPADYTPEMHHKQPYVNTIGDAERLMIDAVLASLNQQEGEENE